MALFCPGLPRTPLLPLVVLDHYLSFQNGLGRSDPTVCLSPFGRSRTLQRAYDSTSTFKVSLESR
jgi:hypothetical protein